MRAARVVVYGYRTAAPGRAARIGRPDGRRFSRDWRARNRWGVTSTGCVCASRLAAECWRCVWSAGGWSSTRASRERGRR